jgi:predicted nucleic acid-binding protein
LIALFDQSDAHHQGVREFLRENPVQLVTTWPVITEVTHMLDFDVRAQLDFLRWIAAEGVVVFELDSGSVERAIELMDKYKDRPMDLADASLIVTAERLQLEEVLSIDRDFDIYRTKDGKHVRNLYKGSR